MTFVFRAAAAAAEILIRSSIDLERAIGRLRDYATVHFKTEEGLMRKSGLVEDYVAGHQEKHRVFVQELDAFEELVRRYDRNVFRIAQHITQNREDAEDVVQDAFLKAYQNLKNFQGQSKFYTWLVRIAVNESLNVLRTARREESLEDGNEAPGLASADPEWQASEAEVSARIQRALMSMKPSDRVVLTLRHFSDCSYEEIGRILDIEVKTVKSRLFEARQRLRALLEDLRPA